MTNPDQPAIEPELMEVARKVARRQFMHHLLNRDNEAIERYLDDLRRFQASGAGGQVRELALGAIEALAEALDRIDDLLAAIVGTDEP